MRSLGRILLIPTTAALIFAGYSLINFRVLARSSGYDEVYYYYWVENWENYQVYYPHHLLFTPTSVAFQNAYTDLTGIDNTAFVQRFKNIVLGAAGLGFFFILFYLHSKRFWLALIITSLIAFSGSLWHDVHHHETSAIPGVLINLAMLSLVFYRRSRFTVLHIIVFASANAVAILLHQVYLLSIPVGFAVFFFTKPARDRTFKVAKRVFRSGLYLVLVIGIVGGVYFYIGFSKLDLRATDNPGGTQVYMSVPIEGNFFKYFYLIESYGKWGNKTDAMLKHGIIGYMSSFVTHFHTSRVDFAAMENPKNLPSNVTLIALGSILLLLAALIIPVTRKYGALYPALLVWFAGGSLFVIWWEPGYIEHWIYLTILTWLLFFMVLTTLLDLVPKGSARAAFYTAICVLGVSFGSLMVQVNYTNSIIKERNADPYVKSWLPVWREEYSMSPVMKSPDPSRF